MWLNAKGMGGRTGIRLRRNIRTHKREIYWRFLQPARMAKKLSAGFAVRAASRVLGYSSLKQEQLDITVAFMLGQDVFAVLPTGFGQSLCFAVLPLAMDNYLQHEHGFSIVIVLTPLLAIIMCVGEKNGHKSHAIGS